MSDLFSFPAFSNASLAFPSFLRVSPWNEQVPFLMWLVEQLSPELVVESGTRDGVSFFAFCQAISSLSNASQCRCYALTIHPVDARLETHARHHFPSNAWIENETLDEALARFDDQSIDLLNFAEEEGLPTANHEEWLKKLSSRSVVLIHGTASRRSLRPSALLMELREKYPFFTVPSSSGLTIVITGEDVPMAIRSFAGSNDASSGVKSSLQLFHKLGQAISLAAENQNLKDQLRKNKGSAEAQLLQLQESHAQEHGGLTERAALIESFRSEQREEIIYLRHLLKEKNAAYEKLIERERDHLAEQVRMEQRLEELQISLRSGEEAHAAERARNENVLRANETAIAAWERQLVEAQRQLADTRELVEQLTREQASLKTKLASAERLNQEKLEQSEEQASQLRQIEIEHGAQIERLKNRLHEEERELAGCNADLRRLRSSIKRRDEELARMTELLLQAERMGVEDSSMPTAPPSL